MLRKEGTLESKTTRKMAQVKERGGGRKERKEMLADKPRDFEDCMPTWPVMPEFAHRHLMLS